jgi:hypothetical protein
MSEMMAMRQEVIFIGVLSYFFQTGQARALSPLLAV